MAVQQLSKWLHTNADRWSITEPELDLEKLAISESIFALSNGHLGLRGNLDEGEPFGELGTYLNGVYELRPMPHAEAGYGYPESGQTVINVTNGKIIRLLVDDEPFDVRYGRVTSHVRTLDLRAGTLRRSVEWETPAGQKVRVTSTRLVSLTQRAIAAIHYEVEAIDRPARVVVQSELVVNEPLHEPRSLDPRVAAALRSPLTSEEHLALDASVVLVHRADASGLRVAAGMDHLVECDTEWHGETESLDDLGRFTVTASLEPRQVLRVVKFLGYGWSSIRSNHALRDQAGAVLQAARGSGWDVLLAEQRTFLDEFWECNNVSIRSDPDLEMAVRFGMFHALQAGARAEGQAIPAKGLTGTGYDGHAFWDTEMFVLRFLNSGYPTASSELLRWRHSILPMARVRADVLGLSGAAHPWRTIDGEECSGYWPAGTAAFHVNAAVADATQRYIDATNDTEFESRYGLELMVEAARLFESLGHHDDVGMFHIDGVTGPDEYSALADDNVYTNLMACQTFLAAIKSCERLPNVAATIGVTATEIANWQRAHDRMHIPFDQRLGVHPQSSNFTNHPKWNFEGTAPEDYPLLQSSPYFDLYRKQVVKQADIVLAMHQCPDRFTDEEKLANYSYYESITVRDSSLSAISQGIVAAELGHLELAADYLEECAFIDLQNFHGNTGDGLHLAASVGAWLVIVEGFGGLRITNGALWFAPRSEPRLGEIAFTMRHLDRRLSVCINRTSATYALHAGAPLIVHHHGLPIELTIRAAVIMDIPTFVPPTPVSQPFGRPPRTRWSTLAEVSVERT